MSSFTAQIMVIFRARVSVLIGAVHLSKFLHAVQRTALKFF